MNTKINFQVLNIVNQDSGALGPLGMIIHQFPEPGLYRVAIQRGGRTVADTAFHVDPAAGAQINIDLAAAARRNPRHGDCECKTDTANPPQVSPKGYVLFHASAGDGYSAAVTYGNDKVVFETAKLGKGDIYATSLLEPGKYTAVNSSGDAKCEIEVAFSPDDAKNLKQLEAVYVDASSRAFAPARLRLASSQGVVFRVQDSARIVITRQGARDARDSKPVLQWRKPVTAK